MRKKIVIYLFTIIVAFSILLASVLRTASVRYEVCDTSVIQIIDSESEVYVDYYLPYPGEVLPDSPLWSLKALRDKLWLSMTTSSMRKVELKLLFADKRIASAVLLFQEGKMEKGIATLSKAEKYLEEASYDEEQMRRQGVDTSDLLYRLTNASLKHYQVMTEVLEIVPDDVKQLIIEDQNYPKKIFERGRNGLLESEKKPPVNPFDWQ